MNFRDLDVSFEFWVLVFELSVLNHGGGSAGGLGILVTRLEPGDCESPIWELINL